MPYDDIDKNNDKEINGEPLFYTTTQVAEMIDEEPSTIRFWSKRFERLLDVEVSNRNKQYKKKDIEKLRFIKKLAKEDGLTLQQVEDYCNKKGFDGESIESAILQAGNPLAIQVFTSAVMVEVEKKLNLFAQELIKNIDETNNKQLIMQKELNDKLHETIVTTVDEVVSERIDNKLNEIKVMLDNKELEAKQRDNEMMDILRKGMEQKKVENENENKKGFWSRFKK